MHFCRHRTPVITKSWCFHKAPIFSYFWLITPTNSFQDFIIINHLQSFLIEVCIYLLIAMLGHDHSSIYLARGPYSLFTALYFLYLREIPVVPYASLFGISISAHTLPIIMFIHVSICCKSLVVVKVNQHFFLYELLCHFSVLSFITITAMLMLWEVVIRILQNDY